VARVGEERNDVDSHLIKGQCFKAGDWNPSMESRIVEVGTESRSKKIIFVGEIHIYGNKESKKAKEILTNYRVDYCFIEGPKPRKCLSILLGITYRYLQFFVGRNEKTLVDLAKERKIKIKNLEEGTAVPIKTQIGLAGLLLVIIFSVIYGVLSSILERNWISLIIMAFIIVVVPFLVAYVARKLDSSFGSKIARLLPVDKVNRDKIMSAKLIRYIEELDFSTAVVVVGKTHLPPIVEAIENNFDHKVLLE
jgi:hypothetical protein